MIDRANHLVRRASALMVLLSMLTVIVQAMAVENAFAAADIDVTIQTQVVNGISATFGFNLQHAPQEALARPGTDVTLGFAPGPLPSTLIVDVLGLLGSAGISIPAWVTDFVNSTADSLSISNPWVSTIPIADTPVGSYRVYSLPLYEGLPVYLDINLVGVLKGDLSASAGSLEKSHLTWTKWGGQDVNLTLPSEVADVTVSAAFRYSVNNDYVIRFDILGFYEDYPIASFSLGEIPLGEATTSHIEVVDDSSTAVNVLSPAGLGLGAAIGGAVGLALGILMGKKGRKQVPKSPESPEKTSAPPG